MGVLRVLSDEGDRSVLWDQERAAVGDLSAQEAVREAERVFQEQRSRGATAFKVAPGVVPERLETFDPEAYEIIMVPRVTGG